MVEKPLTSDQVLALIRERIKAFDDVKIYYALRQYKFKPIRQKALELVKVCLAMDSLGLIITSDLVSPLIDVKSSLERLHTLGDKHILIYKRKLGQHYFEWLVHPVFKKLIL